MTAFTLPASMSAGQSSAANRTDFDQLLQAAEKARNENRDEDAIQLFRRALSEKPDSEEGLWYLGSTLHEREQFAGARDVLRQFMTIRPDAGPGWALLGISEFKLREYRRALEHLQRAISLGMGDREKLAQSVYYDAMILLTRFERYDDSLDLLQKMLATDNSDPALVQPAGLAGLRLPYLPAEIPPDQRDVINLAGEGVMAIQTQHDKDADVDLDRLTVAYPDQPGVHFLRGAYLAQMHPQEATKEFERELSISPSHVLARVRLAQQLVTEGDFDRALTLSQQAIQLDPKRASPHMMAGEALIGKGDAAGGIRELETARDVDPSITRVHWDLLRAYGASGRKEDSGREKMEIEKLIHSDSTKALYSIGDSPRDFAPPN